ncbi:MAG: FtsW/RodA/SpoVE family cell cycle protein [Hespellia sp.]|nr:FtsW/RodA/SpoVE family cell cycle protein [Hespellia sp.]
MNKRDYLMLLTEQIRNKRARQSVESEIGSHIDDQISGFMADGMTRSEAEKAAIDDMGDPVKTGVSLDIVHKPKMNWSFYGFVLAMSAFSIILMWILRGSVYEIGVTMVGIIGMTVVCYVDYTFFCRYVKVILISFVLLFAMTIWGNGLMVNGVKAYLWMPFGRSLSLTALIYLYVPIYAVILFQNKNGGYKALIKCVAFMILPVFLALCMPCISLAMNMLLILLLLLSIAIYKKWFCIKRISSFLILWSTFVILPLITGFILYFRLGFSNHFISNAERVMHQKQMIQEAVSGPWRSFEAFTDYYIAYLIEYFGMAVVVLIIAILAFMICKVFQISIHQSNQQGQMIGIGCGLIFATQTIQYILMNLNIIPPITAYLPFFSWGGSDKMVSYLLLGLILSIYRYQSIPDLAGPNEIKFVQRIGEMIHAKK